jgi:predicted negative regulator of RcsB-dependent stress response
MTKTDIAQNNKITLIVAVLTGLSALTGFLLYLDKKQHSKVQHEIDQLDKSIKELQLNKLRNS